MKEELNDFFNKAIVFPTFHAERNILIWQYIGEEWNFLKQQEKSINDLYSFIQQAAQTNFILALGKIFDLPSKNYPTRSILSFLKLINSTSSEVKIVETTNTIKLLKENNCSQELIESVNDNNQLLFPKLFANYYIKKMQDENLQIEIKKLKIIRDKTVAHNEAISELFFEFKTAEKLLEFSFEIISIYGMAYNSAIWKTKDFSFMKKNAENEAYFIKSNIQTLKNK